MIPTQLIFSLVQAVLSRSLSDEERDALKKDREHLKARLEKSKESGDKAAIRSIRWEQVLLLVRRIADWLDPDDDARAKHPFRVARVKGTGAGTLILAIDDDSVQLPPKGAEVVVSWSLSPDKEE